MLASDSKSAPVHITEDEAALYDRQIRLWGMEAQQKMRNATILVIRLRGIATEVIKNIVLAGVGKLIIIDGDDVAEEDLGAGFFFTDNDVGKKKVDAAKGKVESLNPLVAIETISSFSALEPQNLRPLVQAVDLVCLTDAERGEIIRIDNLCRTLNKPFYAGGSYGLLGYICCDLLKHDYISPDRSAPKDSQKNIKVSTVYPPLETALRHRWTGLTKRQTKEVNPAVLFSILALWEFQARHQTLPSHPDQVQDLETIANGIISAADVHKQVLSTAPHELLLVIIRSLSTTAAHEFSPVCAVVGGVLGQDILKCLAAREPPIANFFTFNGNTGGATVCRLGMLS
ncbi:hypothetical protein FISHEDRAFT_67326 [Fistulina hepatica ATCC 64428]|uniref:THIF-type NAD/FAD binding fold domain-containing protein n=1 Tax=Fistulina hepatica ATCC 64428 TaxID=1128425 RepID=A0A0D7A159_9AGAR|nr:hypothetical protein FISHEDRAFT_67326 [Fistulina hepatica ATCC 64428]